MIFNRNDYINLTDIRKTYRIPTKIKDLTAYLEGLGVTPVISRDVNLGAFSVQAKYYLPADINKIFEVRKK